MLDSERLMYMSALKNHAKFYSYVQLTSIDQSFHGVSLNSFVTHGNSSKAKSYYLGEQRKRMLSASGK